jgi:16S rRNA (guanine527-N7)-methyltransferase
MDYLNEGLRALGIGGIGNSGKEAKLEKYLAEILLFNPTHGLVSGNDKQEIIIRHILDSLAPWQHIAREAASLTPPDSDGITIADIGTGAGFPGIPLAIVMDNCRFLLIEKMGRRVSFLQNVKAVLRLENIAIIESEVEKAAKNGVRTDMTVCRGFSEINDKLIGTFSGLLQSGGVVGATDRTDKTAATGTMIFYKGKREKIDREIESCESRELPLKNTSVIQYAPPFLNEERHLVIIRQ